MEQSWISSSTETPPSSSIHRNVERTYPLKSFLLFYRVAPPQMPNIRLSPHSDEFAQSLLLQVVALSIIQGGSDTSLNERSALVAIVLPWASEVFGSRQLGGFIGGTSAAFKMLTHLSCGIMKQARNRGAGMEITCFKQACSYFRIIQHAAATLAWFTRSPPQRPQSYL